MINVIFGHNNAGLTRLGIVVSAKFSKKAVERNRIKRQIRAILKKNAQNIIRSRDIVIMVRKYDNKTSFSSREIEQAISNIFMMTGLFKKR